MIVVLSTCCVILLLVAILYNIHMTIWRNYALRIMCSQLNFPSQIYSHRMPVLSQLYFLYHGFLLRIGTDCWIVHLNDIVKTEQFNVSVVKTKNKLMYVTKNSNVCFITNDKILIIIRANSLLSLSYKSKECCVHR